jgi:hypothetical protein
MADFGINGAETYQEYLTKPQVYQAKKEKRSTCSTNALK